MISDLPPSTKDIHKSQGMCMICKLACSNPSDCRTCSIPITKQMDALNQNIIKLRGI